MQKIRVPQNSFQFGEVSDSLIMRTDTGIYTSSAQKIENMIVTAEGSARKRQGLKHIYDYSITYNSSYPDQSHLFPFIFDNNEQYIISVEHQKVRRSEQIKKGKAGADISYAGSVEYDEFTALRRFKEQFEANKLKQSIKELKEIDLI